MISTIEEVEKWADADMTEEEKEISFTNAVKHLRRLQHEIDDVAKQAAIEISRLRYDYNYWFNAYGPFLRQHALEKAPTNREGVKAKHYKNVATGGGVFFRSRPGRIAFDPIDLANLWTDDRLAKNWIRREVAYKVAEPEKLRDLIRNNYPDYVIEETPTDPLGHMYVGTERGWTPRPSKQLLSRALEGTLEGALDEDEDDISY